jgi:predicted ATPase
MKKPPLPLQSARLRNFKAVRDSGVVKFTPLTAFIGNNGSGKSSLIEGLEALKAMVLRGLDEAMQPFRGFEYAWNKAVTHDEREWEIASRGPANPMRFEIGGQLSEKPFGANLTVTVDRSGNEVFFRKYDAPLPLGMSTDPTHLNYFDQGKLFTKFEILDARMRDWVGGWQFLNLEPASMLYPRPQRRSTNQVQLERSGANIAEYLLSIRDTDARTLAGIIETLGFVLPYTTDVRPSIASELGRDVYLMLEETTPRKKKEAAISNWKLPNWLMSQGTLRILCLLAVFRHPKPPSVVFIEEIENGLDPRTVNLIVDEIRGFLTAGGQVVITTHSPYLLDLLDISQIIVVDRAKNGEPEFKRPSGKRLKLWAKKFAPGRLYTMGSLTPN